MAVARLSAHVFILVSFLGFSTSVLAVNPFKKTVDYEFPDNVSWALKKDTAYKTGKVQEGSDVLFFHLSINDRQLRLRFSKNDPSGLVINSRSLSSLVIEDVLVDGQRLPLFQWCLDNQQLESKEFKQDTPVDRNACVNSNGDFVINLNEQSRELLRKSQTLEIVSEPFRRTEILTFGMTGYAALLKKLEKPVAPVIQTAKPVAKPKPVAVPKPVVKKAVKTCLAKAPAEFKAIKPVAYPCSDAAKKANAEGTINKLVAAEKKRAEEAAAEAEERRKQQATAAKEDKDAAAKAEAEWEKRQAAIWIKRCQRHWAKRVSPCYCKKYIEHAPKGVQDTCPSK